MKVRKELIENASVIKIATPEERAWAAGYVDCLREIGTMDVDRLRELVEADKAGRVVALPCKVGDVMYEVYPAHTKCTPHDTEPDEYICSFCNARCDSHRIFAIRAIQPYSLPALVKQIEKFGKTVFLTREEAEKALEEAKWDG